MSQIKVAENLKEQASTGIKKIVVNSGIGKRSKNSSNFDEKILPRIKEDISRLAGQMPQVRTAKKSIAGFGVREGDVVGLRVTLRGNRMVDFLDRLVRIVLPRMSDFRGVPIAKVDDGGALHLGFKEQYAFPEIDAETSTYAFSFGVNIVPEERDRESAIKLYREIGVPLQNNDQAPSTK